MSEDSGRLLVVDDNEDNRDMLSRRLARRGYAVAVAVDGAAALALLAAEAFDLVLLDVMMPGVDGFQVLTELRRTRSLAELPVIMATARDRNEDVVRALELGANDYVTKPLDFAVVHARVRTQLELQRARRALERANRRMKRDLEAGARIQRALIPQAAPALPGVAVAWAFEPCAELGGDIFDVFEFGDGWLGLYLLDVSGHGVPAALTSVTLSRMLSHMGADSLLFDGTAGGTGKLKAPAAAAAELNRRFPMEQASGQYFTLLYGALDPARRKLHFVAAGHPAPLVLKAGAPASALESGGPPIGMIPEAPFTAATIALEPGDRLYFFSDGILEARSEAGEFFGDERLVELLAAARAEPIATSLERLVASLRSWCRPSDPDDDVSVLGVEITG